MDILLSFAALIPHILIGYWIVHFLWGSTDKDLFLIKVFLSTAVGLGFSSLMGFLWIWAGLPLALFAILEIVAVVALTAWMFYMNWGQWKATFDFSAFKEKINYPWGMVLIAGAVLFAINLWIYSLQYPHGRPDAWINWNVVARFIYLGGPNWQNTFYRLWDHPDYPLFLAIPNAITWIIVRSPSTWGPIAFHSVFSFFAAGLLFSFMYLFRGFAQASLAAVLFVSLPFTIDNSMRQYADLPLSYFILGAGGLALLCFNRKDKGAAILSGLLAGLAGWTKNEGLVAIAGFTVIWAGIGFFKQRSAFKDYLLGLAFPLVVIVLFKLFLAPSNDLLASDVVIFEKITDAGRYVLILREAGFTLWNIGESSINIVGLIIIYAVLVGRSKTNVSGMWLIGSLIFIQLFAYFMIYLLTPYDLTWHLNTSLSRLYSHVIPLALLWMFIWLKSPQELPFLTKEET